MGLKIKSDSPQPRSYHNQVQVFNYGPPIYQQDGSVSAVLNELWVRNIPSKQRNGTKRAPQEVGVWREKRPTIGFVQKKG